MAGSMSVTSLCGLSLSSGWPTYGSSFPKVCKIHPKKSHFPALVEFKGWKFGKNMENTHQKNQTFSLSQGFKGEILKKWWKNPQSHLLLQELMAQGWCYQNTGLILLPAGSFCSTFPWEKRLKNKVFFPWDLED